MPAALFLFSLTSLSVICIQFYQTNEDSYIVKSSNGYTRDNLRRLASNVHRSHLLGKLIFHLLLLSYVIKMGRELMQTYKGEFFLCSYISLNASERLVLYIYSSHKRKYKQRRLLNHKQRKHSYSLYLYFFHQSQSTVKTTGALIESSNPGDSIMVSASFYYSSSSSSWLPFSPSPDGASPSASSSVWAGPVASSVWA